LEKRKRKRLGRTILTIPDCQVRPGVDVSHMTWIAKYIERHRPDVIVCLGDYADMNSLSLYDKGKVAAEGTRYVDDIKAARDAMAKLCGPIHKIRGYHPEMHLTYGNHCQRIVSHIEANPSLVGKLSLDDLGYKEFGWTTHPFLKVAKIASIEFVHFAQNDMGRPITSARALLQNRQCSIVVGHKQATDLAFHNRTGAVALMAGVAALHDEPYLGWQLNAYRRQVWMLLEADGTGYFDPLPVSLRYLANKYG